MTQLKIFCGPMCAGKTDALIEDLMYWSRIGHTIQAFVPAGDRHAQNALVSRTGATFPAIVVTDPWDALVARDPKATVIAFDEVTLRPKHTVEVIERFLLLPNIQAVLVSGLDMDWRGKPMPPMPDLCCLATSVIKLTARCSICNAPASRTLNLKPTGETIQVGDTETYAPACFKCFSVNKGES
jgi:thymidine kinase